MDDLISRKAAIEAMSESLKRVFPEHRQIAEKCLNVLPSAQPEPCEDAVSRKDAIRWVKTECNPYGKPTLDFESGKRVIEHLEQLPSAQPEIMRCKDCKHKHLENMVWTCPFGLPGGENFFCGYGAEPYKGEQE